MSIIRRGGAFYVDFAARLWYYYRMSELFDLLKSRAGFASPERTAALRAVPAKRVPRREALLYAALPALFAVIGFYPVAAPFVLPELLALLYLLYRRFGIYLPLWCVGMYMLVSLVSDGDALTVIYGCGLVAGLLGTVVGCCIAPYLASAAMSAVTAALGAAVGVAIVLAASGVGLAATATDYVLEHGDDPIVGYFARDYYAAADVAPGEEKLLPGEPGYYGAALRAFAEAAGEETEHYIWYYCIHYGGVCGAFAFLVATAVNKRTSSAYDAGADEESLRKSTRAMGGVRPPQTDIADMKLPRTFLLCCVLPAFVASVTLYFVGGYDFLTSTVTHTFVTVPGAFGCFTLLAYFVRYLRGGARKVASVALVGLGVVATAVPIVFFVLGVIGLCDCILDIRHWTELILAE